MSIPVIQSAFSAGEISPSLYGHVDLAKMHVAASTLRNLFVSYRGGAYSRAGTAYVAHSKQRITDLPPRLITFQFNINQNYALEFGEFYMRVFVAGAPVVETPWNIVSATRTNPAEIGITGHPFVDGDWVVIEGVLGMTELNGNTYIVTGATVDNFFLEDLNGNAVNALGFGNYISGGTASRIFTLTTPWNAAALDRLKFTQSADVMTFTHPLFPPYDLARIAADNWTVTATTFGAGINPPGATSAGATVNPSGALLPTAYAYVVTSVSGETGEESVASPIANVTDSVDIAATAGSIILDWTPIGAAGTYNVYKAPASYNTNPGSTTDAAPVPAGALFGYAGTSYGNQFVDSNIVADLAKVPPIHRNPFAIGQVLRIVMTANGAGYTAATVAIASTAGTGFVGQPVIVSGAVVAVIVQNAGENYAAADAVTITGDGAGATATVAIGPLVGTYPSCVAYFQQRRAYAGSNNNPDTYWMSQPGKYKNFDAGIPVSPADAITGTPWAQQVNGIQFMLPMPGGLVVMTGLGAWQVGGTGSSPTNPQAITPSSEQATPQAFNGCSMTVPPITISNDILYVQTHGSTVRDLKYNYWLSIYTGTDLTELSSQLFIGFTIRQWAWCEEPFKVVWAVRNDGAMLSLTYLPEQEVFGWARHDTFGLVWSVCAVTELPVDALYLVVARQTAAEGGNPFYAIERMNDRIWTSNEDPWCVDCGLEYPMPTPAADVAATATSGATLLLTDAAVFGAGDVGSVARIGGGIAVVTGYVSATEVAANWVVPPSALAPDDPGGFMTSQPVGRWTLTAPVSAVSGLFHLANMSVVGLADGVPIGPLMVSSSGVATLPFPATSIRIGLAFTPQLQSVYLDPSSQPTVQGRRKNITAVTVRVEASGALQSGSNQPDGAAQVPIRLAPAWTGMVTLPGQGASYTTPGGAAAQNLFTGDQRIPIPAQWAKPGQIAIQQTLPQPMNVTALIPEVLGGDVPEESFSPKRDGGGGRNGQQPRGPGVWQLHG